MNVDPEELAKAHSVLQQQSPDVLSAMLLSFSQWLKQERDNQDGAVAYARTTIDDLKDTVEEAYHTGQLPWEVWESPHERGR